MTRIESMSKNRLRTAGLTALLLLLALFVRSTGVRAGDGHGEARSRSNSVVPRVTLNYQREPLERVLEYISRSSRGINVVIKCEDPAEEEDLRRMPVTVELTDVTWITAVNYIAEKHKFVVNREKENDGIVYLERPPRVTMSVQGAPLTKVIKMIAMGTGQNIIPGPEVSSIENVSFDLHDVPWKDALQSILKTYGLVMVEEKKGIIRIVSPASVQATHEVRAIQLQYLQPFGTKYKPKLPGNDYVSGGGGGADASTSMGSLLDVLNQLKSADGTISYEQRTNMLIIKDTATNIEAMKKVIQEIDREPMQVKIKVRMVTINTSDADRKGVQWGGETDGGFTASVNGGRWQTVFPFTLDRTARQTTFGGWGDMGPLAPVVSSAAGPVALRGQLNPDTVDGTGTYSLGNLSFEQLTATLQILRHSSNSKVIQAPELVVLDNQEATIHMGQVLRYAEFYADDTGSGYKEAGQVNAGVQLIVIPHICGTKDQVIMEVVPKTEDFDPATDWKTFGSGTGSIQLPQTRSKIVVTKMMLKSRETGVIGGLMNTNNGLTIHKVPILGDIPILGYAFKKTTNIVSKENLLIFVTPTILGPRHEDDFQDELESVRKAAASLDLPDDDVVAASK